MTPIRTARRLTVFFPITGASRRGRYGGRRRNPRLSVRTDPCRPLQITAHPLGHQPTEPAGPLPHAPPAPAARPLCRFGTMPRRPHPVSVHGYTNDIPSIHPPPLGAAAPRRPLAAITLTD